MVELPWWNYGMFRFPGYVYKYIIHIHDWIDLDGKLSNNKTNLKPYLL